MRLIFQRMADRRPVETVVERDDGVVFTTRGAGGGAQIGRAEALADLVGRLSRGADVLPGERAVAGHPPERLAAAAAELAAAARRWWALAPGDTWTVEWGVSPRAGGRAGRRASPRGPGGAPDRSRAGT